MKKNDAGIPTPPVIERKPGGKWRATWKGKTFGSWEFLDPKVELSPDRRHWVALAGTPPGRTIVLDGREYGPYDVPSVAFMPDGLCFALFRRAGAYWIFLDGREIGPYRHRGRELIAIGGALLADLDFTIGGKRTTRRCVVAGRPLGKGKYVFFSPNNGASFEQAIEIINAAETGEGIAAEYLYLGLKHASERKMFEIIKQEYVPRSGRHYDKLTVELKDNSQESYYFDITSFYGRFAPEIEETIRS